LLEAVILEANLIKKHWPKYNVKDKDNKSFVYLVFTNEDYPKPIIVRGRDLERYTLKKGVSVFGPYQSYHLLKKALDIVRRIFPYRTCTLNSGKPCFHYQIGLCPGVCTGDISKVEYKERIKELTLFFEGDKKRLLKKLQKNTKATEALSHIRDVALLSDSGSLLTKKDFIHEGRIEGYDISHSFSKNPVGAMVVFENAEPDVSQYRLFNIKGENTQDDLGMLKEVLIRRLNHLEWKLPDIIFVDGGLNQVKLVNQVLKERNIVIPVVGLSKSGVHSASSSADKLVAVNLKKTGKELIQDSKKLFQQVRNEAHRFAISASKRQRKKKFIG